MVYTPIASDFYLFRDICINRRPKPIIDKKKKKVVGRYAKRQKINIYTQN